MTSVQSRHTPRNDDHAAQAARRAGNPAQNAIAPGTGAEFAGMVAASRRNLEADRLAAMKDSGAAESRSKKAVDFFDDNAADDGANASSSQSMPRAQDDTAQGQVGQGAGSAVSTAHCAPIRTSSEESPDWLSLASLLPAGEDDGVFEVIMPNRAKVGVTVNDMPAGLSYLLMPEDSLLADRLRSHEMELEALLKRRIRRNVKVVVL